MVGLLAIRHFNSLDLFTMSNDNRDSTKTNQIFRPKFNLDSTAARLALRGKGFANSAEFPDASPKE